MFNIKHNVIVGANFKKEKYSILKNQQLCSKVIDSFFVSSSYVRGVTALKTRLKLLTNFKVLCLGSVLTSGN